MTDTCATCRHWHELDWEGSAAYGACRCSNLASYIDTNSSERHTRHDFGCILHEPAPDWCDECAEDWFKTPTGPELTREEYCSALAEHIRKHWQAAQCNTGEEEA